MPKHDTPRRPVPPLPRTREEWDAHVAKPSVQAQINGSNAIRVHFGSFLTDPEVSKRVQAADNATTRRTCKHELVQAAMRVSFIAGEESINAITALSIDDVLHYVVSELHDMGMTDFKYDPWEDEGED